MIALILARGGSKGLPGKNIKMLNGKPLIAYTIEAALNSRHISRVIVNTDDYEIASIAKQYGAEIPFMRPLELATDEALSIDVLRFVVKEIENTEQLVIDEFILLQPTSPLRNSIHIDEAIDLYKSRTADSVISYCQNEHPIQWYKYIDENLRLTDVLGTSTIKNRQELSASYYPNGAIFIFKKALLNTGQYYNENSYAYIMDRSVSIDIDTLYDFNLAGYLLSKQ